MKILLNALNNIIGVGSGTAQKMESSIKDFFSKCDQIRSTPDLLRQNRLR